MTNILLVDDHGILLDGLESILLERKDMRVKARVNSGPAALEILAKHSFDLMITDYYMPGMDGLALVKNVRTIRPDMKIIVLSMIDEPGEIRDIMVEGIDGYVLKKYARQELFRAIDSVMSDRQYWSPEACKAILKEPASSEQPALTARELEVLKLLTKELTSKEISQQIFISERTVETHRKNLLRKTGSSNTVGLIKYAYAHKLI